MNAIDYRIIPIEELHMNEGETARRLHTAKGFDMEIIGECLEELKKVAVCKFSAVRNRVEYLDNEWLDIGFGEFTSATLMKNLQGCKEVFIFAVTLGHGVDRLLNGLSRISPAKYFITDALASSLAEAAADKTDELLRKDILCRPRFSPGFGDLKLDVQPKILEIVNGQRLLGITTNKSYMMSPGKSVTAIMGIKGFDLI